MKAMARFFVLAGLLAVVGALSSPMLLGCDGDGDADGDADGDGDADCEPACHAAPFAITKVTGTVTDDGGTPLSGVFSVVCITTPERSQCLNATSDAAGIFSVDIPAAVTAVLDVAVYFPGEEHLTPYCKTEALCDGEVELCGPYMLWDAPASGVTIPAETETLAEEIRLEASDGAALIFQPGTSILANLGVELTAALTRFEGSTLPCFIDPSDPPLALYAVTPQDTLVIEPGTIATPELMTAALDLPNETGLAAGATVDIYVVGGAHASQAGTTEGTWEPVATATVTADGTRIQTAPGEGIGQLNWFGVYAR